MPGIRSCRLYFSEHVGLNGPAGGVAVIGALRFPRVFGLVLTTFLVIQPALAQSVKILNVGDSDVAGHNGYASYRYDLWFLLRQAGYDVDFVGRVARPISVVNADLYPRFEEYDNHFEGRYGLLSQQISQFASTYVEAGDPDIVMFLGSHDICEFGGSAPSLIQLNLGNMIDNMRAVNPDLHFLLGQIYPWEIPSCDPDAPNIIPEFNQRIASVAGARDSSNSRVIVVDHYSGFNYATMFDGNAFHANRQGEMFMASNWFDALEDIIPLVEPEEETISINAGLNDAWFDPTTPGQGFFITVFPNSTSIFLAWFTYDTERPAPEVAANLGEPGHRWLTAFGTYSENSAVLEIELTSGGIFNEPQPMPVQAGDGEILLEFHGCNSGTITFNIDSIDQQGVIPIERIALDNVAACESTQ